MRGNSIGIPPDCASLHPGYARFCAASTRPRFALVPARELVIHADAELIVSFGVGPKRRLAKACKAGRRRQRAADGAEVDVQPLRPDRPIGIERCLRAKASRPPRSGGAAGGGRKELFRGGGAASQQAVLGQSGVNATPGGTSRAVQYFNATANTE